MRNFTTTQMIFSECDRALRTLFAANTLQARPNPAPTSELGSGALPLSAPERQHSAGLMRINHTGEVAAQALYFGHAAGCKSPTTRQHMLAAALEEGDHLAWCSQRLQELDAKPSLGAPLFYAGAFGIGWVSALISDRAALSFVAETERQVEAHLLDHEQKLPANDHRSRQIVATMRAEEAAHGANAMAAGGTKLPWPIPLLMNQAADLMRWVAYRF